MSGPAGGVAAAEYWAVTTSDSVQANGPAQRFYVTTSGTLVLVSKDGSTFTITPAANTWTPLFGYPITTVKVASTATGIIAEGWGAQ